MGSEDLFKKRKARDADSLKRQKNARSGSKRYLIVCEGTKTEPQYFNEILSDQRISPQRVKIAKNQGSSPDRVVAHALELYEEDAKLGDPYDKVFCVFDRDAHTTFEEAVERVRKLKSGGKPFVAITSTPCFEFWLLLHFGFCDAPFHSAGKKSVGDQAIAQLKGKRGFKQYSKGMTGVYALLKGQTQNAVTDAKSLRKASNNHQRPDKSAQLIANPWTNVDELVEALLKMK